MTKQQQDEKFQRFLRWIILATVFTCSGLVLTGIFAHQEGLLGVGIGGLALFLFLFLFSLGKRPR